MRSGFKEIWDRCWHVHIQTYIGAEDAKTSGDGSERGAEVAEIAAAVGRGLYRKCIGFFNS